MKAAARSVGVWLLFGATLQAITTPNPNQQTVDISVGQTVNGVLEASDARSRAGDGSFADSYQLTLTTARTVTIAMSSRAFDTYLIVVDSAENPVGVDDDGGGGTNSRLELTLQAGTFIIEATSFTPGDGGPYTLSVSGGAQPPAPTPISVGQTVNGVLEASDARSRAGDGSFADSYQLTLTTARTVTIAMSSSAFDTYLIVVDGAENPVGVDDDGGGGTNSRLELTLQAGTFIIEATSFTPGDGGPYTLSVSGGAQPPPNGLPPVISKGGIVLATLLPTVNTVSPLSIISVFGQNFSTETILFPNLDSQGKLDTILGGTCLMMNGEALPIFAITPAQINAQALADKTLGPASFTVVTNCATAAPISSTPLTVEIGKAVVPTPRALSSGAEMATVEEATPGFFLFPPLADDGLIAARFNSDAVAVAPDGMFTDEFGTSRPAMPGEIIVLYGTGWGETTAGLTTGELATGAAEVLPGANPMVSFGGIFLAPEDVFYVGVTPQTAGLFQLAIRVPAGAQPGNNQVVLTVYGRSTPVGPVIPVAAP